VLQVETRFAPGVFGGCSLCTGPSLFYSDTVGVYTFSGSDPASVACLPQCDECTAPDNYVGQPIDVLSGNVVYATEDVRIPGPLPVGLSRRYNSQDDWSGAFGTNWRHSYDSRLTDIIAGEPNVKAIRTTGRDSPLYCGKNALQEWYCLGAASFDGASVTRPGGIRHEYLASGQLGRLVDGNGNTITLGYDTPDGGKLLSITDAFGRALSFAYHDPPGEERVRSVTLPGSPPRTILYDYDASFTRLTGAHYPDGADREYEYGDARFPDAMTR
jgi:hypothetical protein